MKLAFCPTAYGGRGLTHNGGSTLRPRRASGRNRLWSRDYKALQVDLLATLETT
jgi:hypothetical protein